MVLCQEALELAAERALKDDCVGVGYGALNDGGGGGQIKPHKLSPVLLEIERKTSCFMEQQGEFTYVIVVLIVIII